MKIITFNGPIGCGKSWVCDRLQEKYKGSGIRLQRISFQDPLARATQIMLGVEDMNYDSFKVTDFYGLTGREWMIRYANSSREITPNFYSDVLYRRMKRLSTRRTIFLADSNGFADELLYLRGREDVEVLACSIEPPDAVLRGTKYPNDSRFNLAAYCAVVQPDSNKMLPAVIKAGENRGWFK